MQNVYGEKGDKRGEYVVQMGEKEVRRVAKGKDVVASHTIGFVLTRDRVLRCHDQHMQEPSRWRISDCDGTT